MAVRADLQALVRLIGVIPHEQDRVLDDRPGMLMSVHPVVKKIVQDAAGSNLIGWNVMPEANPAWDRLDLDHTNKRF